MGINNTNQKESEGDYKSPNLFMENLFLTNCMKIEQGESQTDHITNTVIDKLGDIDQNNLEPWLPNISSEELVARGVKAIVLPLKQLNMNNPFLSTWNEISAKHAAKQIGLPDQKLHKILEANGPIGIKLRQRQATVSLEIENEIKNELQTGKHEDVLSRVRIESWIMQLSSIVRSQLNVCAPHLPKEEKGHVIEDVIMAFIKIIDFGKGQKPEISHLLALLVAGRLGTCVNIVGLHCLSFKNSPSEGITVSNTADDFVAQNNDGSRVLITQRDSLEKVREFVELLSTHNINNHLTLLLVDNDAFVMEGQQKNVDAFADSLEKVACTHLRNKFSITRTSVVANPQSFSQSWHTLGESTREKLVDQEFERLNRRLLPPQFHTRDFARLVARQNFLVQFSLGATLTDKFDHSIILQRAKAHQQATDIFQKGARSVLTKATIITHWKDMTVIE